MLDNYFRPEWRLEHLRNLLPAPLLSAADEGPNSRDRVVNLRLTFECFIWQMLKPKISCREVVRQIQALLGLHNRDLMDEGNSAYIQARQRLPRERLEKALDATAQTAVGRAGSGGQPNGRPVKVIDGSTTQLPDTSRNQKCYPQPTRQKPGCGFPVMKLAVLFSQAGGAVLNVILDSLHNHDLRRLARKGYPAARPRPASTSFFVMAAVRNTIGTPFNWDAPENERPIPLHPSPASTHPGESSGAEIAPPQRARPWRHFPP
jgi:hypothetical protein